MPNSAILEQIIRREVARQLNCTIHTLTKISEGLYSAICKLPGGTIAQFKCELKGNQLLIDTF